MGVPGFSWLLSWGYVLFFAIGNFPLFLKVNLSIAGGAMVLGLLAGKGKKAWQWAAYATAPLWVPIAYMAIVMEALNQENQRHH